MSLSPELALPGQLRGQLVPEWAQEQLHGRPDQRSFWRRKVRWPCQARKQRPESSSPSTDFASELFPPILNGVIVVSSSLDVKSNSLSFNDFRHSTAALSGSDCSACEKA